MEAITSTLTIIAQVARLVVQNVQCDLLSPGRSILARRGPPLFQSDCMAIEQQLNIPKPLR